MTTRYTQEHYDDVADILRLRYQYYHSYETRLALESAAQAFAVLFAADTSRANFDRDRFLKACGLESEGVQLREGCSGEATCTDHYDAEGNWHGDDLDWEGEPGATEPDDEEEGCRSWQIRG